MNKKRRNKKKYWLIKKNKNKLIKRTKRKVRKEKKKYLNEQRKPKFAENVIYNKKKQEYKFIAPQKFSIMDHPIDTINYFNNILSTIDNKKHNKLTVNFILNAVNYITIDALMYMLAITKNTKKSHFTKGSYPIDEKAKSIFVNSGFLNYVKSTKQIISENPNDNIRIKICNNSDENRNICKTINLLLMKKYNIERKELRFLYDMLYEMMINTNEHAYNTKTFLQNNWYLYVELHEEKIKFSFLDTGMGIPYTINKNFFDKLTFLGIKTDADLILSALNGQFKTSTKLNHRGKGLPKFTKYNKNNKIMNFKIVSGKGKVTYDNDTQEYITIPLDKKLIGTVYYFEVNIIDLKEEY